jgi:hypothetical protein
MSGAGLPDVESSTGGTSSVSTAVRGEGGEGGEGRELTMAGDGRLLDGNDRSTSAPRVRILLTNCRSCDSQLARNLNSPIPLPLDLLDHPILLHLRRLLILLGRLPVLEQQFLIRGDPFALLDVRAHAEGFGVIRLPATVAALG